MKKSIIFSIVLFLFILIISTNSSAATDFSNVNIEFDDNGNSTRDFIDIKVTGVTLDDTKTYYAHFSNSGTENITVTDPNSVTQNLSIWNMFISESTGKLIGNVDNLIALAGDIYIYIAEVDHMLGTADLVVNGIKIERLAPLPLGSRITAFFFSDYTSTFLWEVNPAGTDTKIKYKIGEISDKNILNNIKNGKREALSDLLSYAKNSPAIVNGTGSVQLGNDSSITGNLNLVDKKYYFVYLELDTENGKYYPVEDVSLYQGLIDDVIGKNLYNYLSSDFKWNLDENNVVDNTNTEVDDTIVKGVLPNAGAFIMIPVITIITVVGIFAYIKVRKMKEI